MKPEDLLKYMHEFFNSINQEKIEIQKEINLKEAEQQDLLHEIEFSSLDAVEMMKIAKRLKTVRKERRVLKNELEKINTLKGFADKYNNKFITADISQVLKNLETLENNQKNKKYTTRVLNDLKISDERN